MVTRFATTDTTSNTTRTVSAALTVAAVTATATHTHQVCHGCVLRPRLGLHAHQMQVLVLGSRGAEADREGSEALLHQPRRDQMVLIWFRDAQSGDGFRVGPDATLLV